MWLKKCQVHQHYNFPLHSQVADPRADRLGDDNISKALHFLFLHCFVHGLQEEYKTGISDTFKAELSGYMHIK